MWLEKNVQNMLGKKVAENPILGYQCVALVKYFSALVFGVNLGGFGGSAKNGFSNPNTFPQDFFSQKNYRSGMVPKTGSIIFFDNMFGVFGHTGVVLQANQSEVLILEQNGGFGTGNGQLADMIREKSYGYKNIIGWREPKYSVDDMNILSCKNQGISDGKNLDQMLTRGQAATILVRIISNQSLEYQTAIQSAKAKKIFDGSRENVGVTRQELAIMISRSFGLEFSTLTNLGVWSGADESKIASRLEGILMIARAKNIFSTNQNFFF